MGGDPIPMYHRKGFKPFTSLRDHTVGTQSLRSEKRTRAILNVVQQVKPGLSAHQISANLCFPLRTTQRKLQALVDLGMVARATRPTAQGSEVIYRAVAA